MVNNAMKQIIRMLPIVYIVAIWLQSSLFNPGSVEETPGLGEILEWGHLLIFGILYILIYLAWLTYGVVTPKKEAGIIILTLLFALGDEVHQYYVPYRSASLVDILKDVVGIYAAWFVIRLISKSANKLNSKI